MDRGMKNDPHSGPSPVRHNINVDDATPEKNHLPKKTAENSGNGKLEPFPDGRRQIDPDTIRSRASDEDLANMTPQQRQVTLNNEQIQRDAKHQPEVQVVHHTAEGEEIPVPPNTPAV